MERIVEDFFERSNGKGWIHIDRLLTPEVMGPHVKMYAKVTVDIDSGIGYHQHIGDGESYYILEGSADYIDEFGEHCQLQPGDVTFTKDQMSHGIYNAGNIPLVFMALIIKSE